MHTYTPTLCSFTLSLHLSSFSTTTAQSTVPSHPTMVSCADMVIVPTSLTLRVVNRAPFLMKSRPVVLAVVVSGRAAGHMVVISHHMVNSKAELEGETKAGQAMAVILSTILAVNHPERQAHSPPLATPVTLQPGQTEGLLNNQAILNVR